MNTAFLLMAQYDGAAMIPVDRVCRDYFFHLTPEKLVRKISAGAIALPLVRIKASERCAKGVHPADLAQWIDERAEAPEGNAGSCVAQNGFREQYVICPSALRKWFVFYLRFQCLIDFSCSPA